ncbi:hypothetical protein ABH926_007229 [Catenulispora sp. GP43]
MPLVNELARANQHTYSMTVTRDLELRPNATYRVSEQGDNANYAEDVLLDRFRSSPPSPGLGAHVAIGVGAVGGLTLLRRGLPHRRTAFLAPCLIDDVENLVDNSLASAGVCQQSCNAHSMLLNFGAGGLRWIVAVEDGCKHLEYGGSRILAQRDARFNPGDSFFCQRQQCGISGIGDHQRCTGVKMRHDRRGFSTKRPLNIHLVPNRVRPHRREHPLDVLGDPGLADIVAAGDLGTSVSPGAERPQPTNHSGRHTRPGQNLQRELNQPRIAAELVAKPTGHAWTLLRAPLPATPPVGVDGYRHQARRQPSPHILDRPVGVSQQVGPDRLNVVLVPVVALRQESCHRRGTAEVPPSPFNVPGEPFVDEIRDASVEHRIPRDRIRCQILQQPAFPKRFEEAQFGLDLGVLSKLESLQKSPASCSMVGAGNHG